MEYIYIDMHTFFQPYVARLTSRRRSVDKYSQSQILITDRLEATQRMDSSSEVPRHHFDDTIGVGESLGGIVSGWKWLKKRYC